MSRWTRERKLQFLKEALEELPSGELNKYKFRETQQMGLYLRPCYCILGAGIKKNCGVYFNPKGVWSESHLPWDSGIHSSFNSEMMMQNDSHVGSNYSRYDHMYEYIQRELAKERIRGKRG